MHYDQTVLITGGTSGIGEAMVRKFHETGYRVWFTWRSDRDKAEQIIGDPGHDRNRSRNDLLAFKLDLAHPGSHQRLMKELPGVPDILINNAGLGTATVKNITPDADEQDRLLIHVNATGTLLLTRAVLEGMQMRGSGRIIFISSVGGGINVFPGFSFADGMSKAAITYLGRQLAAETVHSKIRVFTLCPGATDTPMFASSTLDHLVEVERNRLVSGLPGGRLIEPEEIAVLALYLCGKPSDVLHGSVIDASLGLGVNPGLLQK